MGIADEDIERVRTATDLVAIIGETVGLSRAGARYRGLCPFHSEKSPSFYVNGQLGFYKCFGCQASGDAFTWVRETEHLTFVEAVRWLAAKCGVQLQEEDEGQSRARRRRAVLLDAMRSAVDWYHERLLSGPDAKTARGYLRAERGYDSDVVRAYSLGWAPEGWDELVRALRLPDDVMRDTGLGFLNDRKRQTDSFRGRVLFPIFDHTGDPVAIGGRQLPEGRPPKYKNSAETPLYRKSETLYGLNWAKNDVVKSQTAVLCEGYTDVIAFHRAGVPTAVATCGTAVTEDHVKKLARFGATRIVLGYDADGAGQGAAAKFHTWEAKLGLDVRVVDLPQGSDPADLGRRDPDALRRAVDDARPMLEFRVRRFFAGADLTSAEGRARAAQGALALVVEHPDALVRDQYVLQVADETRLDADVLRGRARDLERAGGRTKPVHQPGRSQPTRRGPDQSGGDASAGEEPPPRDPDDGGAGAEVSSYGTGGNDWVASPGVARRPRRRAAIAPAEWAALWWIVNEPARWVDAARMVAVAPAAIEGLAVLFGDELAADVYRMLCHAEDLTQVAAGADDQVGELIADLATREAPPEDPQLLLPQLAHARGAERKHAILRVQARTDVDLERLRTLMTETAFLHDVLGAFDDQHRRNEAAVALVAFLMGADADRSDATAAGADEDTSIATPPERAEEPPST